MKILRGIEKLNFFFFLLLCYAFTLAMALNHVLNLRMSNYDDGDCKTITCSLSLAPSYMKSASIFSLQNAQLQCAIMEVSTYTELWKTVNFFFLQRYATFILFLLYFPSSTSISIRLSRGILFQYCSAYRNSILIFKLPFSCCRLHISHFMHVVNFCRKNFSLTKWHAIAKINLQFHNFIVIHSAKVAAAASRQHLCECERQRGLRFHTHTQ